MGDIFLNHNLKLGSDLLMISLILLMLLSVVIGILFSIGNFNKKKVGFTLLMYILFIFFLVRFNSLVCCLFIQLYIQLNIFILMKIF